MLAGRFGTLWPVRNFGSSSRIQQTVLRRYHGASGEHTVLSRKGQAALVTPIQPGTARAISWNSRFAASNWRCYSTAQGKEPEDGIRNVDDPTTTAALGFQIPGKAEEFPKDQMDRRVDEDLGLG